MKKTINIILLISFLTLFGCSKSNDEKIESNAEVKNVNLNIKKIDISGKIDNKKGEVKYNKEKEILYIGNSVAIQKGLPDNFPFNSDMYKNSKTFTNSNVKDYIFYIADSSYGVKIIGKYYLDIFNKLGYERVLAETVKLPGNIKIKDDLSRLEFVLKNEKYSDKIIKDKKGIIIPNTEKKYIQRVLININEEVPLNIKKGIGLKGRYIEIYYNQL